MRPILKYEIIRLAVVREAFGMGYFYPHEAAPGSSILGELQYAVGSCRGTPLEDPSFLHLYVRTCEEVRGGTFYWCHLEMNRQFRSYCEQQETLGGYHATVWSLARRDAEHLHEIYVSLDMLSTQNVSLYKRRQHLACVRKALGDELFELGYVPPSVPIHRFTQIDH